MAQAAKLDGPAEQAVIDGLRDIAPDLGRFIIEFAFGASSNGLSLPTASATVAALWLWAWPPPS
jgi:4-carboxymuconolactone decarboxylase